MRMRGRHVLHPMGWDAFGLPAEQYAIKTGQHPRETTKENVGNFRRQIQSLGFSYDWSREVDTTDPGYFKWSQWIFLQLYSSWYNPKTNKAESIESLKYPAGVESEEARREFRDDRRLAFVSDAPVNWCPELGTVLANEEVIDGKSEVGGHPVVRRLMRQWMLRITAYAQRLLDDLETIDWSDSLKEMQRNWIGRSEGAEVVFGVRNLGFGISVFTTRPDTLFGATYMVLSPEHSLVDELVTEDCRGAVEAYRAESAKKSDLERTELAKDKTGVSIGACAVNPVNDEEIPIWIADYVLASYGTGAIMAVPGHDERDLEFARKYELDVRAVVQAPEGVESVGFVGDGVSMNSGFISGLPTPEAKVKIIDWLEEKGCGKRTINFKLRDWLFSRQRYWGEPFPIVWRDGHHEALPESELPVLPPELDDYKPTTEGNPPLARAADWVSQPDGATRETNTMPQWAGSCWYYLRYLDARNEERFVDKAAERYWMGAGRKPWMVSLAPGADWGPMAKDLVVRAFCDGKRLPYVVEYAPVSEAFAAAVRGVSDMEVAGFCHSADVYAVRHIFNRHGVAEIEIARGNEPLTLDDLKLLPALLESPDDVSFDAQWEGGFKRFIISKQVNGMVYVVEEARGQNGQMQLVTMWKKKTTARDVTPKAPLSSTSETGRRENNKPRSTPFVKPVPGVDLYVGGTEHAVLHLLYARFWHKVLFDLGHVSTAEPFYRLVNQGIILGDDGQKMSKSRGNVISPDVVLADYGADAFRLYEMFMGPLEMMKPWNMDGVAGVYRFLGRVWRLFVDEASFTEFEQAQTTDPGKGAELLDLIKLDESITDAEPTAEQQKALHACIKKVTDDLDGMRYNTAISALMIFVNEASGWETKPREVLRTFLLLLNPFAPHLAEELASRLGEVPGGTLAYAEWPVHDEALLVEDTIEFPVQVNGKLRGHITIAPDTPRDEIEKLALACEKAKPFFEGKELKKVIVVPNRLVNIAAK
jgi:leucyl-tRNA synthetase